MSDVETIEELYRICEVQAGIMNLMGGRATVLPKFISGGNV